MHRLWEAVCAVGLLHDQDGIDAALFHRGHDFWIKQVILRPLHQYQECQRSPGIHNPVALCRQFNADEIRKDAAIRRQSDRPERRVDGLQVPDWDRPACSTSVQEQPQSEGQKRVNLGLFRYAPAHSGLSLTGRSSPPRCAADNAAVTKPVAIPNTATPPSCIQPPIPTG
jgi:hypothetical protein